MRATETSSLLLEGMQESSVNLIALCLVGCAASPMMSEPAPPSSPESVSAMPAPVSTVVTTFAGNGMIGSADGTASAASFRRPYGIAVNATGTVYVGDWENNRLRQIAPSGVVTTLAGDHGGFADGTGSAAMFATCAMIGTDAAGNIYVGDSQNSRVRKVTPTGVVTTFAGSGDFGFVDATGTAAQFASPQGVALDGEGYLYVADKNNYRIRKISPTGEVTTFAGSGSSAYADGTGTGASFEEPTGVAVDEAGMIYVSDAGRIRKITPDGVVTTLAGSTASPAEKGDVDGTGATARFNQPVGLTTDELGNVYIADAGNSRIRRIDAAGNVTTIAGSGVATYADGLDTKASFNYATGVAYGSNGALYVADWLDNRIRKLSVTGTGTLVVSWAAPSESGDSAVSGYTATATAPNLPSRTCMTSDALTCTLTGLHSGIQYSIAVTATNDAGASEAATAQAAAN
jgi:hypothetical protein